MRLQRKLSLAILPAILGPMLIIGGISYYRLESTARTTALETMRTGLDQLSATVSGDIHSTATSVKLLAIASPIITYVAATDADARYGLYQPNVLALLSDFQRAYPANRALQIRMPDGSLDVDWSRNDETPVATAALEAFVARLRTAADGSLVEVQPERSGGKPLLLVGTVLKNNVAQGPSVVAQPLGYLIATFDLAQTSDRAEKLRFGESGGVLLTDSRGRPWPGPSRPANWNPADSLTDLPALALRRIPEARQGGGIRRYVSVRSPHPQLMAVASIESDEVGSAGTQIAIIVAILMLLTVLAMHRLIYSTVKRVLLVPAQNLIAIARDMAAGNLEVPVGVGNDDELGDLGRALSDLGNGLARSQRDVAQREAERERAVEDLRGARDRAEAANRSKSEFLARMSHEIRTPMNGVLGMTELLRATALDDRQRHYASTIQHSGESLLCIINDVLDFSKIEAGRLELDCAPFDLRELVEESSELLAARAHGKGLNLICDMPSSLHTMLLGDAQRLRQVFMNLLGNAIKFTSTGQITVRVRELSASATVGELLVEIEDTGIGIQPENQSMIFDSFTQEDGSTTRRFGGTGLGLAISRQLVALMGGTLAVRSEPGVGSTFFFTLRLARDQFAATRRRADTGGGTRTLKLPNFSVAPYSVLLVEDNPVNLEVALGMLENLNATVTTAHNGCEALEILRRRSFDVVLMDCQMPQMDGYQATRAFRALEMTNPQRPRTPIIALTANALRGDEQKCRDAGMDAYLSKPFSIEQLAAALNAQRCSPDERRAQQ